MKWKRVETYRELVAAAGAGPWVVFSGGALSVHRRVDGATWRRAKIGARIGARTWVLALPELPSAEDDRERERTKLRRAGATDLVCPFCGCAFPVFDPAPEDAARGFDDVAIHPEADCH